MNCKFDELECEGKFEELDKLNCKFDELDELKDKFDKFAKRGVPSGANLFADTNFIENRNKLKIHFPGAYIEMKVNSFK